MCKEYVPNALSNEIIMACCGRVIKAHDQLNNSALLSTYNQTSVVEEASVSSKNFFGVVYASRCKGFK